MQHISSAHSVEESPNSSASYGISPLAVQSQNGGHQNQNMIAQTNQVRLGERSNTTFDPSTDPVDVGQGETQLLTPCSQTTERSPIADQTSRKCQENISQSILSNNHTIESRIGEHRASFDGIDSHIDVERQSRNLEHILDPATYYGNLDKVEADTAEICGIGSGPDLGDLCETEYITMIKSAGDALRHLRTEALCGDEFTILVESCPPSNIARAVHVSLGDIESFLSSCSQGSLGEASYLLSTIFGHDLVNQRVSDYSSQLKTLARTLSIGLVSFSGSHVCPFDLNLWGHSQDRIPIGFGYSYRRRKLACLDEYLKGPCWVLGPTSDGLNEGSLKISLTVGDLQELWGPVQLVGGTPMSAPLLRTQRGYVVPLPPNYQSEKSLHGIDCHWTETVPDYVEDQDHIWLDNFSLIMIGTDAKSQSVITVNARCKSKSPVVEERVSYHFEFLGTRKDYTTMEGYDVWARVGYGGSGIGVNRMFRRRNQITLKDNIIWQCQQPDPVLEPFLKLQVGLEISLCTGNARRVSLWEAIRLYHIEGQDTSPVMCEHSIPNAECARSCWVREHCDTSSSSIDANSSPGSVDVANSQTLLTDAPLDLKAFRKLMIKAVLQLKGTGIDREGHLRACWPFSDPAMSHHMKTNKINRWIGILSDSLHVATFAVVSSRCLGFDKDKFPNEWSPCPQSHSELTQINCLSTTVLQRPPSEDEERLNRQKIGLLTPPSSCDSDDLLSGTAFRLVEKQLWITRFWRENEARKMMAHPFAGHYLREVATSMRWSAAIDFKEQINPDLKGGDPIDLVILSKPSGGQPSG